MKLSKRVLALIIAALFLLTVACEDTRIVVDAGGVGTEKNLMISEAAQNTTP